MTNIGTYAQNLRYHARARTVTSCERSPRRALSVINHVAHSIVKPYGVGVTVRRVQSVTNHRSTVVTKLLTEGVLIVVNESTKSAAFVIRIVRSDRFRWWYVGPVRSKHVPSIDPRPEISSCSAFRRSNAATPTS